MYMQAQGLSGYRRRGMGIMGPLLQCADGSLVETGAQCPGFVAGNMSQSDQQQYEINALWQQLQMSPGGNNLPIDDSNRAPGQTFTQWVNANSPLVIGGALALLVVVGMRPIR